MSQLLHMYRVTVSVRTSPLLGHWGKNIIYDHIHTVVLHVICLWWNGAVRTQPCGLQYVINSTPIDKRFGWRLNRPHVLDLSRSNRKSGRRVIRPRLYKGSLEEAIKGAAGLRRTCVTAEQQSPERERQRGRRFTQPSLPLLSVVNHFTDGTTLNTTTTLGWKRWENKATNTGYIASQIIAQRQWWQVSQSERSPASAKCFPEKRQTTTSSPYLAIPTGHSVLQSLSTDCRVLRSCRCRESLYYYHRFAHTKYSTILKLAQSLCIDCEGSSFRGAAPTKQVWQAKIRLHEVLFAFYAYGNLYEQIAYLLYTIGPFSLTHKETEPRRP